MSRLSAHELYAIKLYHLDLGYALFEPDPNGAYDHVDVGDVGYIEDGKFNKLFNAFEERSNQESQNVQLPESFQPIAQQFRRVDKLGHLPPGTRLSESVRTVGGELSISGPLMQVMGGASVQLSCTSRSGAALITKDIATRKKALSSRAMEKYMVLNCQSWLRLARTQGLPVEMHDLVFVRERVLTGDWDTAAWDRSSCSSEIRFMAGLPGIADSSVAYWGQWEDRVIVPRRQGPLRLEPTHGEYSVTNFDQCIFLKGIRIAEREWYEKLTISLKVKNREISESTPESVFVSQMLKIWKLDFVGGSKSSFRPVQKPCDVLAIIIFLRSDAQIAVIDDKDLSSFHFDQMESMEQICATIIGDQNISVRVTTFGDTGDKKVGRISCGEREPPINCEDDAMILDEAYNPIYEDDIPPETRSFDRKLGGSPRDNNEIDGLSRLLPVNSSRDFEKEHQTKPYDVAYEHVADPGGSSVDIIYTDEASPKLSDKVRRRCFNCCTTGTSMWRGSSLNTGKVLCNKCGSYERIHSRPRPVQHPQKLAQLQNSQNTVYNVADISMSNPSTSSPPIIMAHKGSIEDTNSTGQVKGINEAKIEPSPMPLNMMSLPKGLSIQQLETSEDHNNKHTYIDSSRSNPTETVHPSAVCEDTFDQKKEASVEQEDITLKRNDVLAKGNRKPCGCCPHMRDKCELVCKGPRLCESCHRRSMACYPPLVSTRVPRKPEERPGFVYPPPDSMY